MLDQLFHSTTSSVFAIQCFSTSLSCIHMLTYGHRNNRCSLAKAMDMLQKSISAHTCEAIATQENENACLRANASLAEDYCKEWHLFIATNITFTCNSESHQHTKMLLPNMLSISVWSVVTKSYSVASNSWKKVVWLKAMRATMVWLLTWHWCQSSDWLAVHLFKLHQPLSQLPCPQHGLKYGCPKTTEKTENFSKTGIRMAE